MARVIRYLRNCLQFPSSSASHSSSCASRTLIPILQEQRSTLFPAAKPNFFLFRTTRPYISEMRRSAFDGNILRLIRNEIQYELERSPPNQPVTKYGDFEVDERPGEQWVRLKGKHENENIKIEATMFDGAIPTTKSGGSSGTGEDVLLHITMVVNISKGDDSDVLEIMCSAWPDSLEIDRLFIHRGEKMPAQPYQGPEFKELDDELQNSLYEYLEARGVDDQLAVFLHKYMKNKDKTEFIRWMQTVKTFVEIK